MAAERPGGGWSRLAARWLQAVREGAHRAEGPSDADAEAGAR